MSKKKKLYNLRLNLSKEIERVCFLLENIAYKSENPIEINVFADLAFEKSYKISKISEKIGKILKH